MANDLRHPAQEGSFAASAARDVFMPSVSLAAALSNGLAILRRGWLIIVITVLGCGLLAGLYVTHATPLYTANGAILIDPRVGQGPGRARALVPGLLTSDALTVDSELRVLTSRELTGRTFAALQQDAAAALEGGEADAAPEVGFQRLIQWLSGVLAGPAEAQPGGDLAPKLSQAQALEAERRAFVSGLKVERAGDSFVIDIAYTSADVDFGHRAVNRLITEYMKLSNEQQLTEVARNSAWLSARLTELGQEVEAAEAALTAFRLEAGLLTPDGAQLPTEIALNAATDEMVRLRIRKVALEVRLESLGAQIALGNIDAIETAAADQGPALRDFMSRYIDLRQQAQEAMLLWSESSDVTANIQQQIAQVSALILDEYRLIHDRLLAQRDTLEMQVSATEALIADLRQSYAQDAQNMGVVDRLAREVEAKRAIYEQLLRDYTNASQLLSFEADNARVIAWAVVPDRKSAPRSAQILATAIVGSLVLSVVGVLTVDAARMGLRKSQEVEADFGLPVIGVIPDLRSDRPQSRHRKATGWPTGRERMADWAKLPRAARGFDHAAVVPDSATAETMRALQVQLALERSKASPQKQGLSVGFTSGGEGEGKTTAAFNFATALASQNQSVVLVDFDVISRGASRLAAPLIPADNRLTDLLDDPVIGARRLQEHPEMPGLKIVLNDRALSGAVVPDLKRLKQVIEALKARFDYVVVDLPPLQGAADTQVLCGLCDALTLVLRWGKTTPHQLAGSLQKLGTDQARLVGGVFSQVKLRRYLKYNRDHAPCY